VSLALFLKAFAMAGKRLTKAEKREKERLKKQIYRAGERNRATSGGSARYINFWYEDGIGLEDALVAKKFISRGDLDDPDLVKKAVKALLDKFVARVHGDNPSFKNVPHLIHESRNSTEIPDAAQPEGTRNGA
jgi:hypothetical protein